MASLRFSRDMLSVGKSCRQISMGMTTAVGCPSWLVIYSRFNRGITFTLVKVWHEICFHCIKSLCVTHALNYSLKSHQLFEYSLHSSLLKGFVNSLDLFRCFHLLEKFYCFCFIFFCLVMFSHCLIC